MGDAAPDLVYAPVVGLREIWEAVEGRAAGDRSRTRSACIAALNGRRGATWVKQRFAIFSAFRDHGIREIALSEGYSPSQMNRNRGVYAPFEVSRWLGSYARRIDDEDLRSLLTWHLRWANETTPQAPVPPPSTPHLAGLLRARTRVTDTLELLDPMRIVERYVRDVGKPGPTDSGTEHQGPDPAIAQLRSHVPDEPLWNLLEQQREAIDRYERGVHSAIQALEEEALALTGMSRGYGYQQASVDPRSASSLLDGFLYGPFDHAFALLSGQAPSGYCTYVDPFSSQHPDASKLRGGWANIFEAALGDREAIERARSVLHELDEQLLYSPTLRQTWSDYTSAQAGKRALVARFAELDEARISRGHCWGC